MITVLTMTPDEKERFEELKEKVESMEKNFLELSTKINSILSIVKGIAIGIAIGGLIFGVFTLKDLINVAK